MIPRPRLRPIARRRRRAGDPREVAGDRAPRRGRNAQQPRRRVRYPRPPRGGAQDLWPGARRRVTELSRWGRSTQDLVQTLDDLHSWKVSVLAQTGLSFDLSTAREADGFVTSTWKGSVVSTPAGTIRRCLPLIRSSALPSRLTCHRDRDQAPLRERRPRPLTGSCTLRPMVFSPGNSGARASLASF